ncbi:MAG: hypothetical protein ACRCTI_07275 [Beijerinckiaceae bacterium]
MSLSQAIPWRGGIETAAAPGASPRPDAIAAAVRAAEGVLVRRGQRAEIAQDRGYAAPDLHSGRYAALLAHAICEVSSLAQSQTCVRIRASRQGVAISGRNPLDLPEDRLQLDDMLRLRCAALSVGATLYWEQGIGPCLVLNPPRED